MSRLIRMLCLSLLLTNAPGSSSASMAAMVSGLVRAASAGNPPISGARITLFTPSLSFFKEARTDVAGRFEIEEVAEGTYRLGCVSRAYEYAEDAVTVGATGLERDFLLGPEAEPGRWDIIGTTAPEFLDATDIAILLPSGRILYCHDTTDPILFDPVTGDRQFPPSSPSEQGCMNGSLLADGRLIIAGGQDGADPGRFRFAVPWVKTYAPATQTWTVLEDMQHALGRWYPGLARLADGSFLVMGGGTCCSAVRTETCERIDLETLTWTYTGSMVNPTEFPPSALLYTGDVLATWWPPQLYDPASGAWRLTGNFNQTNRSWPGHSDHSLVVLEDGRALAVGVLRGPEVNSHMGEIYDPAAESWSLTSNPGLVRFQCEVVQLPDGRILVAGGETEVEPPPVADVLGVVKWTDLYDPATDAWRRVADMNWFREYHAVTLLLPDGRVATTGGTRIKFQYGPTSADVEAFVPPYLLRGVRPQIRTISTTTPRRDQRVFLDIAPQTALTSIVLMGVQSTTHWVEGGIQRRLVLPIEQEGTTVTTTIPSDPNVAPLGHYMLFAMVDDIPSEAVILRVDPTAGDIDGDGRVDLIDYARFAACFSGPGASPPASCAPGDLEHADLDHDGDVDLNDFSITTPGYAG